MWSVAYIVSLISLMYVSEARIPGVYTGGSWQSAHATFYGGSDASGTMGMYFFLRAFFPITGLVFSSVFYAISTELFAYEFWV